MEAWGLGKKEEEGWGRRREEGEEGEEEEEEKEELE